MSIALRPSDGVLEEAIRLKCANCYSAMAIANALCGVRSDAWYLCHHHSLPELLAEAESRGLDIGGLRSAVDEEPVPDTLYYRRAKGLLSEEDFRHAFAQWKRGS